MTDRDQETLESWGGTSEAHDAAEAAAIAGGDDSISTVVDPDTARYPDADGTLDLAVTQVDYTIEGTGNDEFPIVHVFGRTTDDTAEHIRVLGVEPYFYVPTTDLETDPTTEYDVIIDARETDANGNAFKSIRGKELTKLIARTPRDVGNVRDEFEETYEADILFPNRFLIDCGISNGVSVPERRLEDGTLQVPITEVEPTTVDATLRVNTFDIEVDDRRGFPEDGEEPIICLTSHDSFRDEYIAWLYTAPDSTATGPDDLSDYDQLDADASLEVRRFDEEAAMLDAFLTYISTTNPDVLTGWNFDDFDAPYLLDRLEELNPDADQALTPDRLSRVDEVWRSGWGGPDIKGRVVFDLLYGYQRTQFSELDSYRLDAVGEQELGVGKERYTGDIGDLWESDPERLLEYNVRDVELCVEIDETQQVIEFWDEVRSFVGCKLEDAPTPGDAVDMYVLHKASGRFALPTKGQQEGEDFEGGAVFDPITGVRENVTVLDLASLYPNCMVTINASPETKVSEDYDGKTHQAPNGTRFQANPDGMMREMVDELLEEREAKKEARNQNDPASAQYEQYDRQQAAVKRVMNCFTPDTEVLTPDGIRSITDLTVGDTVYSLNPDSMTLEVKPVTATHQYPDYDGELVQMETEAIDFQVTPNHRMLVRQTRRNGINEAADDYRFLEAGDLEPERTYELPHDWVGPDPEPIETIALRHSLDDEATISAATNVDAESIVPDGGMGSAKQQLTDLNSSGDRASAPGSKELPAVIRTTASDPLSHPDQDQSEIPGVYDWDDFIELLAWYISEGTVETAESTQETDTHRRSERTITITQDTRPVGDRGEYRHSSPGTLLEQMGIDYSVNDGAYQISTAFLSEVFADVCGSTSDEKRIPDVVFDASAEQKRRFLMLLLEGDGEHQQNSLQYSTQSIQLRDDLLRLCTHLGHPMTYRRTSGGWRISATDGSDNELRLHESGQRLTADDGVYCVTVADNHSLLAGRNGKFQFVGQSLYGVSGWDRFRLYDKESAAAITATGREVIEFTEKAANELDKEVIYGDTDSVMLELGHDISVEAAIEESFEIEDHINSRYDDFAATVLDADEHRFEIEFEKLYRRFFQAGKKKRYAGHIIWKEGDEVDDVDITGFEYKRSDIAPVTKEVQREVIEMVVHGEALDDVTEYLHEVIEDFRAGEVDVDDVGIPGGIGKRLNNYDTDTAHVRGAKYANLLLGTNFQRGSKPKRLYLEKVHPSFFRDIEEDRPELVEDPLYLEFKRNPDVICLEYADQLPEEFVVDWEKMLEKTLKGPISRVLDALDVSWEEVQAGQTQTGLGSFM